MEVTEALGKVCSSQNVVFHKMLKKCTFSLVTLSSFIFLQGALVLDFVCRIKLEAAFVVTGVKVKAITQIICRKKEAICNILTLIIEDYSKYIRYYYVQCL